MFPPKSFNPKPFIEAARMDQNEMEIIEKGESPFKYWVMRDPINPKLAQEIYTELCEASDNPHFRAQMYKYDNVFEKKFAQDDTFKLPPVTTHWLNWTLTAHFVNMIEDITGIDGLIPDPHLRGGGFHMHQTGGILKPHCDFDFHAKLRLMRRLNFIVYLNKNYQKEWGGGLQFWTPDGQECIQTIDPGYNVGVLFETPNAVHGFTDPWAAPDGIARKSLACYLYTSPTSEDLKKDHHSTRFMKLKGEVDTPEVEALRAQRAKGRLSSNV